MRSFTSTSNFTERDVVDDFLCADETIEIEWVVGVHELFVSKRLPHHRKRIPIRRSGRKPNFSFAGAFVFLAGSEPEFEKLPVLLIPTEPHPTGCAHVIAASFTSELTAWAVRPHGAANRAVHLHQGYREIEPRRRFYRRVSWAGLRPKFETPFAGEIRHRRLCVCWRGVAKRDGRQQQQRHPSGFHARFHQVVVFRNAKRDWQWLTCRSLNGVCETTTQAVAARQLPPSRTYEPQ